jgi:hypothetical protein
VLKSWANDSCNFCRTQTTNLTQHNDSLHGQDDHPKTTDYHPLGISRYDGMDGHGIDWLYMYMGVTCGRILGLEVGQMTDAIFDAT